MYNAITTDCRVLAARRITRGSSRFAGIVLLALLTPAIVSAYTVILRSGRHVEIPAQFTVTSQTLTYEASPGINITLLLSTIDIPATERANNEVPGSLMRRGNKRGVEPAAAARSRSPRKELTQADIDASRLAREQSERDYERRRKELGLPSLAESRARTLRETQRMVAESTQARAEEYQSEAYWRARATALRTEIASVDGQIRYIRARLEELPDNSGLQSYTLVTGVGSIHPSRHAVAKFPLVTGHPGFMRGPIDTRALGPGFLAYGGATQGRIALNGGITRGGFGRHLARRGYLVPTAPLFGVAGFNYDLAYERVNLVTRLHELETVRAGLTARWRLLEEEARRSGAQPGWLRP